MSPSKTPSTSFEGRSLIGWSLLSRLTDWLGSPSEPSVCTTQHWDYGWWALEPKPSPPACDTGLPQTLLPLRLPGKMLFKEAKIK